MISLDQIRTLESRVQRVISRLQQVEAENRELRERAAAGKQRLTQLQQQLDRHSEEQAEIERGILSTLEQLDQVDTEAEPHAVPEPPALEAEPESIQEPESPQPEPDEQPPTPEAEPANTELDIF